MKTVIIYKEALLNPSETFVAEQARTLRRYRPTYVGLRRSEPCLSFEGEPLYLTRGQSKLDQWRVSLYRRLQVAPLFHSRARRLHADLIHAHFASDGLQATSLSENLGIPLLVTLHGSDITVRQNFAPRYVRLWNRASLFICVSQFIRTKAIEAGFPAEKLRVHYIGIDVGKFHPPTAPRVPGLVLFVGRLVEKKGCETLLRAMEIVQSSVPEASLAVVGNGPLRPALEALASSLKLPCEFLGSQTPAQIQSWMQKASVFSVPSQTAANGDSEGLPMVILEAQACALPVASTFHSGIPDAVKHGETGHLVQERDHQALAEALVDYLSHPELAAEHGRAGRARVESCFDLSKQAALLEEIYDEVSSKR